MTDGGGVLFHRVMTCVISVLEDNRKMILGWFSLSVVFFNVNFSCEDVGFKRIAFIKSLS